MYHFSEFMLLMFYLKLFESFFTVVKMAYMESDNPYENIYKCVYAFGRTLVESVNINFYIIKNIYM